MKMRISVVVVLGLVMTGVVLFISKQQSARHVRELATREEAWLAEKMELQAALDQALAESRAAGSAPLSIVAPAASEPQLSPAEIIKRIEALGSSGGAPSVRMREAIYWLEQLARIGPAALPAIEAYLAGNQEVEFDTSWFQGRAAREGRLPQDQIAPVSLRLALVDVARRIGGQQAESLLMTVLRASSRGVEVAWLNRALYELSGNTCRDTAVEVARSLLAGAAPVNSSSPLDRYHREYLFAVLAFYGDAGYASEARTQLVSADSQIDRSALRYLQQTLGAQAVPIAAQTYQSPAIGTNSSSREPLVRLALNFVGADAAANEFWAQAINDPFLTRDHRRNLIEDLNQDGFADTRNLTASDLPLIQARMALIEQLAPSAMDKVNAEAFAEAYKDLVNMRAKITGQPPPARP